MFSGAQSPLKNILQKGQGTQTWDWKRVLSSGYPHSQEALFITLLSEKSRESARDGRKNCYLPIFRSVACNCGYACRVRQSISDHANGLNVHPSYYLPQVRIINERLPHELLSAVAFLPHAVMVNLSYTLGSLLLGGLFSATYVSCLIYCSAFSYPIVLPA